MGGKPKLTLQQFLDGSNEKHGFKYDYSKSLYISGKKKIKIICPDHGEFEQRADAHRIDGQGCPVCRRINASKSRIKNKSKLILDELKLVHGDTYGYDKFKYTGNKSESIIFCKIHGDFKQTPDAHKAGKGCLICAKESQLYRRSNYINMCVKKYNSKSNLYILKIIDIDGICFYKVGITVQDIKQRFTKSKMPYDFELVKLIKSDGELIFNTELEIKSMLSEFRYAPKVKFGGSKYECFSKITESAMMLISELEVST